MFIAMIIILTFIDVALFISIHSMQILGYVRQRANKIRRESKSSDSESDDTKRVVDSTLNTALNVAHTGTVASMKALRFVVKALRGSCMAMAGVVLVLDIVVFLIAVSAGSWFLLYSGFYDEQGREVVSSEVVDGSNDGGGGVSDPFNGPWTGDLPSPSEVKQRLQSAGYDKADSLAYIYGITANEFGLEFACGLMGNSNAEGTYGVVEHAFSVKKPYGFSLPSGGTKIASIADINYLLAWDSVTTTGDPKKGSCGVGSIQWSFSRRISYLNVLKGMVESGSPINDDTFRSSEGAFIVQELKGSYSSVVSSCSGKSARDCGEIICKQYEKPKETEKQAKIRGGVAADIYNIITSVR